jgi:hypothetical protein
MTTTTIDSREAVDAFLKALEWAKECGLQYEFTEFFLDDFSRTKDVYSAIWYANCEWDL